MRSADETAILAAWAASGAMALTGRTGEPPVGPPRPLLGGLAAVTDRIAADSDRLGRSVRVDPLALLGERAALRGLTRNGTQSCGGHTRLLRTVDDWVAVALARDDDVSLVPAWLGLPGPAADPWGTVATELSTREARSVVAGGRLLGLPVARLAQIQADEPVRRQLLGQARPVASLEGLTVVDLSALWAGPLCASLLHSAGATVVKVESTSRPDGLRYGDPALFDLLNAGKRSVALDLGRPDCRSDLRRLLATADVVIEAARPRALEQWDIRAAELLSNPGRLRVWLSITGYGRDEPGRDWVALGDDAAVAGGLVVWDGDGPCFCADAVADPSTGLFAAAAVLSALREGGRWLIDVAMARVAASLAGPTIAAGPSLTVAPPRARAAVGRAAELGADTTSVMSTVE